jgi:AcrR family transcriptional regulator
MAVTKDMIADVVEKQVSRFGYRKMTVDDVAGELGVSKKTLYQHFDSKRDMYGFVVDRLARESRAGMAAAVSGFPTQREKVTALVKIMLEMARAHIAETSESEWRAEFEVAADAFQEATGSLFQDLVERGIAAGEFQVTDAVLARHMLAAMVVEYTLMVRRDPTYERDAEMSAGISRYLG